MASKLANLLEEVEALQNLLVAHATGSSESPEAYLRMRQTLLAQSNLDALIPRFVRTCRSLEQFWAFIKGKFAHYHERRTHIWAEFAPLIEALERGPSPADKEVASGLEKLDAAHVQAAWSKALDRRASDPEAAITSARTLLESVCKHILEALEETYDDKDDLPTLYKEVSKALNLAPSQHTERVFKQILGGATAVVEGLGSIRNKLSDAHGKGKKAPKPAARHAELAVNLAGAVAAFLVSTWEARGELDA